MSMESDRNHFLTEQYRDSSNLDARVRLHARFSTNKYGWHRWVYDRLQLAPEAHILELGCGPGLLWRENRERIPEGWEVTLSDLSIGMVYEARQSLRAISRQFTFGVADAQAIPFAAASFDAVIANQMLYHVPDRAQAFSEIRRVLRPGGRFYAATNSKAHMRELKEMVCSSKRRWNDAFNLENGRDQLVPWFSDVTLHRYEDALVLTEVEPLVAYLLSAHQESDLAGGSLSEFTRFVERELASHGAIRVTKDAGLFEAWQAGSRTTSRQEEA